MVLVRNIARRFWPNTLGRRLMLPVMILLVAVAVFVGLAIESLADAQRQEGIQQVVHLGESFQDIPTGAPGTPNRDAQRFLLLAAAPPIQRIAIVDSLGNRVLSAHRPNNGGAYLDETAVKLITPPVYAPTMLVLNDEITYWLPVNNIRYADTGPASDWLKISASLQRINQWRYEAWMTALGLFAVLSGIVGMLFFLTVRTSVKAITDCALFAESIAGDPTSQLTLQTTSDELNRLVSALNRIGKHWHHRLQISEQSSAHLRTHKVAIDLHAAVCITNVSGRIEYVNKHFCIASGYDEQELLGKNIRLLNSGYHDVHYFQTLWRTLALGRIWQGELCNRKKHGQNYWVQCTIAPVKDHLGRPCQHIAIQTLAPGTQRMAERASAS